MDHKTLGNLWTLLGLMTRTNDLMSWEVLAIDMRDHESHPNLTENCDELVCFELDLDLPF